MHITKEIEQLFETIAKEELLIDTLEERHSDQLDFHDTSVLGIKSALTRAFLAGAAAKKQSDTIKVIFTRKPVTLEDVTGCIRTVTVGKTKEFTNAQYDAFTTKLSKEYAWLKGKYDNESEFVQVIKVTAPDRPTLFIDPSGYGYARHVGVQVEA